MLVIMAGKIWFQNEDDTLQACSVVVRIVEEFLVYCVIGRNEVAGIPVASCAVVSFLW